MKVKIKKLHSDAVIPSYSKPGDAGMDLTVTDWEVDKKTYIITYKSGLAVEIPEGYVGLLFPRSSVFKTNLTMSNCVGVIDSGYRGEIMAKFYTPPEEKLNPYLRGDRFAQLIILPYPAIEFEETTELSDSDRGHGGYGSTGK